jgi:RNA polymerase sigma-70 factor (ECF subfamily)
MSDIFNRITLEIPKLRRYARALVRDQPFADDLVQDALARALSKAHLWQEGTDLRAWLFTILHNQYVNHVRRGVREGASVALSETEMKLTTGPTQQSRLRLRDLERALTKLTVEQRQVILLIGMEGMSYEEVATIMNVPVGTIRSRLSRGRDALRALMDEDVRPGRAETAAANAATAASFRERARSASAA